MRAARIFEDLSLRVAETDTPAPGPGEVLVRVHAAGVCGTDLHILDGMIKPDPYPMTLGHEAAGVVEARLWGSGAPWMDSVRAVRGFWIFRSAMGLPVAAGFAALLAGMTTGERLAR